MVENYINGKLIMSLDNGDNYICGNNKQI